MNSKLIIIFSLGLFFVSCARPSTVNPRALAQENACVQSLEIKDYEGAKVRCELCLEYDDSVAACQNGLGLVAYAKSNIKKSIEYFTKAIKLDKNFAQARNNLGAIYFRQDNFSKAIPFFNAAINIDPGYEDARYNLGLSYLRMGQHAGIKNNKKQAWSNYNKARKQYLKLVAVNPSYTHGYRDLGLLKTYESTLSNSEKQQEEDLGKAVKYFKNCLEVDPGSETCHESYGQALLYQKNYDAAVHQFAECLAANKKNASCISGMDSAYQGSQIKSKALRGFIKELKKNPNDAQGRYGYCSLLFKNGLNKLAVKECEKAISLNPKTCPAYYLLGTYYKKTLNGERALANCKSFALCPGNKDADHEKQCNRIITALSGS